MTRITRSAVETSAAVVTLPGVDEPSGRPGRATMTRRRLVIGAGLVVSLAGSGAPGGAAFAYVNAAMDAATRFFRTLAQQGPAAAYAQASVDFRASVTPAAFAQTADQFGLRGYQGVDWLTWWPNWSSARLKGRLELASGGAVVASMRVVKDEAGTWRIAALTVSQAPGSPQAGR